MSKARAVKGKSPACELCELSLYGCGRGGQSVVCLARQPVKGSEYVAIVKEDEDGKKDS